MLKVITSCRQTRVHSLSFINNYLQATKAKWSYKKNISPHQTIHNNKNVSAQAAWWKLQSNQVETK